MKRTIYLNDTTTHNQRPITPECSSIALEEQIMVMEGQKQKSEYPPSNAPILASQKQLIIYALRLWSYAITSVFVCEHRY